MRGGARRWGIRARTARASPLPAAIRRTRRWRGQQDESEIVFTVVTRLELPRLRKEIARIDPQAFVVQHRIDDAKGGMIKRRRLH